MRAIMTKTEWYPGDMKPVRDGVWERELEDEVLYSRFGKEGWFCCRGSIREAMEVEDLSAYQNLPWRGLAQDPALKIIGVSSTTRTFNHGEIDMLMSDTTVKRMRLRDLRPEDWADDVDGSYQQGYELLMRKAEVKG